MQQGSALWTADRFGVDGLTLVVAAAIAISLPFVRYFRGVQPPLSFPRFTADFLNGSVLFPLFLLVDSVFNSNALQEIEKERANIGIAGAIGIFFVVGELVKSCAPTVSHDPTDPPG